MRTKIRLCNNFSAVWLTIFHSISTIKNGFKRVGRIRSTSFANTIHEKIVITTHRSSYHTKHIDYPNRENDTLHNNAFYLTSVSSYSIPVSIVYVHHATHIYKETRVDRTPTLRVQDILRSKVYPSLCMQLVCNV